MGVASAPDLVGSLRQLSLLDGEQLAAVEKPPLAGLAPKELARELVKLGWLTPFQVNQLLTGRGKELVLGEYVLLETLGKGGMGQVYKARQRRLKRLAALKVIRKEFLSNPTTVQRFLREAESAARLAHPNIVTVYDAGEANGVHYLAMEFIDGTTLGDLLKNGPMPVATACDYIRQAALGLQHAHEQGMVHRDLKPHNLMLTKQGLVKVLDLGLARLVQQASPESKTEAMTQNGAVLGTPDYIAPEQAMNARTIDIRADIYSLGCTLYHLLAGRPPFQGESLTETLLKHHLEEPTHIEELRKGLPDGLPEVVRTLMAKKPDDRYQTPAEAAEALAPYCNAGSSATVALAGGRKTAAHRKRGMLVPLLIGGAALLAFLVIAVGALGLYFFLRSPGSVAQNPPPDRTKDADKKPPDPDKKPPDPPDRTPKPPELRKQQIVFQDDFKTPGGFPSRRDQGHDSGYSDGRYFIRITRGSAGWHNGKTYSNFACKVVGKATGPALAGWGLCLARADDQNRGLFVAITREGKVGVLPSPFGPKASTPTIPPMRYKAIRPGDPANELLVVVRGKKVEIFVNSVSVLQPVTLDKELDGVVTALMAFTTNQEARAEFESLTVWTLDDPANP